MVWNYIKAGLIFALLKQTNVSAEAFPDEFECIEEEGIKKLSAFRYGAIMQRLIKIQKENNDYVSNKFEMPHTMSSFGVNLFEAEATPTTAESFDIDPVSSFPNTEEILWFNNRAHFKYSATMQKLISIQEENNEHLSASFVAASLFEAESTPIIDDSNDLDPVRSSQNIETVLCSNNRPH